MLKILNEMELQLLKTVFGRHVNARREKRMLPKVRTACQVSSVAGAPAIAVEIINISPNGMAFSCQSNQFSVGQKVRICLGSDSGHLIVHEGEILNYQLSSSSQSNDQRQPCFRASVRFQNEVDPILLETLTMNAPLAVAG